jgi:hypothetical protein
MNSVELANHLINRAKHLRRFQIERYVDDPVMFDGVVPFDIAIKDNLVSCTVLATSEQEANKMVDNWLSNHT